MADQPPVPPTTHDFPDHWGFYLLPAINRLDDKIDEVRREQDRTAEALRRDVDPKFEALSAKIEALDAKFDQKLTALPYGYWGTLVVIVMGFVTLWLTRP